jgi:hypothetical protein
MKADKSPDISRIFAIRFQDLRAINIRILFLMLLFFISPVFLATTSESEIKTGENQSIVAQSSSKVSGIRSIVTQSASKTNEIRHMVAQSSNSLEFVGTWPYGTCETSAVDATRNVALIGNGNMIQVLDISTPYSLSVRGAVHIGRSPQDIVISGIYAYVVTRKSLKMLDISDLDRPYEMWSMYFEADDTIDLHFRSISLSSGYAYIATTAVGLVICDVSNPENPEFLTCYFDNDLQIHDVAIWEGYAVCECVNLARGLVTTISSYEIRVIDVSNPSAPFLAGTYPAGSGSVLQGLDVTGDGYVCICQQNETDNVSKIAVLDLATNPMSPVEVGSYTGYDRNFEGVAISGQYAFFYENWSSLLVIDISIPSAPSFVGEDVSFFYCSELDLSGTYLGISRTKGFTLFDISAPGNPSNLGTFDTPDEVDSCSNSVAVSGDYVFIANGQDGLRIMDVSNPSIPRVESLCAEFNAKSLVLSGRYAICIGKSMGEKRLYIADISSPSDPFLVSSLDLPCVGPPCDQYDHIDLSVQGDYAAISGTKWNSSSDFATLVIVDISDPLTPGVLGSYVCPVASSNFGGIALSGNYAYLAVSDHSIEDDRRVGLRIIDISDPAHPVEISHYISNVSGSAKDLIIRGNYAYLTEDRLTIVDIANPLNPFEVASVDLGFVEAGYQLAISGDYAYMGNLRIFDISDPGFPFEVLRYFGESSPGVAVSGNFVHLLGSLTILKSLLAPDVSIITPSAVSFLYDSVPIEAKASHSSGIERIELYVDDGLCSTAYASTATCDWDTDEVNNGLHAIRARAYNANGKSSEFEIEVFVFNYAPPLNFSGQKVSNRSLSQSETINVLTWQANPDNENISKYRIYEMEGQNRSLVTEVEAGIFEYYHRNVQKDKQYTYALVAVDENNIESEPANTSVQ